MTKRYDHAARACLAALRTGRPAVLRRDAYLGMITELVAGGVAVPERPGVAWLATRYDEWQAGPDYHANLAREVAAKSSLRAGQRSASSLDRAAKHLAAAASHDAAAQAAVAAGRDPAEHLEAAARHRTHAAAVPGRPAAQAELVRDRLTSRVPGATVAVSPPSSAGALTVTASHPPSSAEHVYSVTPQGIALVSMTPGARYCADPANPDGPLADTGADHFHKIATTAVKHARKL